MEKTESISKLVEALSKAQGQMQGAKKDSENPFFKSSYADLSSVWDACRKELSDNGLAIIQTCSTIRDAGTLVVVETMLAHSSGEWVSSKVDARPAKDDPQSLGSCITYLRRYSLAAVVGVAPEDDDANAATAHDAKTSHQPQRKSETGKQDAHDGILRIVEIKKKEGEKIGTDKEGKKTVKKWTKYLITASDGKIYSTFSDTHNNTALRAMNTGAEVVIEGKEGQYGWEMEELRIVNDTEIPADTPSAREGKATKSQLEMIKKLFAELGITPNTAFLQAALKLEAKPAYFQDISVEQATAYIQHLQALGEGK